MRLGRRRKWVEFEARIDMRGEDRGAREFMRYGGDHAVEGEKVLTVSMSLVTNPGTSKEFLVNWGHASSTG